MINKPDDLQSVRDRARRYVRGIVVAVTLTFAALLFFYATLYGETSHGAVAPETSAAVESIITPHQQETSSITAPSALTTR